MWWRTSQRSVAAPQNTQLTQAPSPPRLPPAHDLAEHTTIIMVHDVLWPQYMLRVACCIQDFGFWVRSFTDCVLPVACRGLGVACNVLSVACYVLVLNPA